MAGENRPITIEEWSAFMAEHGIANLDAFIELLEMDDTIEYYEDDEFWGRPDTEILL